MSESSSPSPVKSAMRTLDIIEYVVSRRRPVVAQEIAVALGIPVSSLSYLLATLVERNSLVRDGRRYSAGQGLQRLQAESPAFSLAEKVAPLVRTLRAQLDETSSFFVRRGWELEALVTETSEQAVRYAVQPGAHAALHSFAAGKALLAALDEAELGRYFAETDRCAYTGTTIVDETALRAELESVRATGIARTREEHSPGICGLARIAAVDGEVLGAFSVAIPAVRYDAEIERRAIDLLLRTTALLTAA